MSEVVPQQQTNPHVEALRQDLGCLNCGYNLRGLTGAVVNCPECGHVCDVADLITRKWTGPWYRAPGLTYVEAPSAAPFIAGVPLLLCCTPAILGSRDFLAFLVTTGVIVTGIWVWMMSFAWQKMGGWYGIRLALVGHLVVAGYLFGIFGSIPTVFAVIGLFMGGSGAWAVLLAVIALTLTVSALWAAWRSERWMAKRCIERYLCAPTS